MFKKEHDWVRKQLWERGIRDDKVLEVMRQTPRHLFVPDEVKEKAYDDLPLPIGLNQTISQPYMVAYMSEVLEIDPDDRVLEIGTGSGYQTAVLAQLAREVYSVEILDELSRQAGQRLRSLGYEHIHLKVADGWMGWPEKAPFDKILVTAAAERIPDALVSQLNEGGRMIFPLGKRNAVQELMLGVRNGRSFQTKDLMQVKFVPFIHSEPQKEGRPHEEKN